MNADYSRRWNILVALTIALLIGDTSALADDPTFPPATPESQGLDSAALTSLAEAMRGYAENNLIVGGELLVIKNRHTVLHETFGWRDRDDQVPWATDTICNIRSMTKPLTGAAAQLLIDRGQLALDDPVAKHLPGFDTDASRAITVRQLLTHRAGIPLTILDAIDQFDSLAEYGNAVGTRGPRFQPDSKFWYSDSGSDALGALIEAVSGQSLDAFVTAELLEPLGMSETFYGIDETDERFDRIASLYIGGPASEWQRFWTPDDGTFYPFAWGSQTLYGTPLDYARFLAMWMDDGRVGERRLLSVEAIERTLTPVSPMTGLGSNERFPTMYSGLEVYYGQMSVLHVPTEAPSESEPVVIGHSGSDGTIAWAWPERDLMILCFTQSRGGPAVLRLEETIERHVIHPDLYTGDSEVPEGWRPFLGTYIADWAQHMNEEFRILVQDGRLALDIPSQLVFKLVEAADEGRWHFEITDSVTVWFEQVEGGEAQLLKISQGPMTFEAPRKGTELAARMAEANKLDPSTVTALLGTYHDESTDRIIEVLVDEDMLALRTPEDLIVHLWPVPGEDAWLVREQPMVAISFQADVDGTVLSMTRHIAEQELVMPRVRE